MTYPVPNDEDARLVALRGFSILDTAPEHAFDRLTRLARMALRIPIVLISLTDRDRQWFKSCQGLSICEAPRSIAFCAHAIQQIEPFIIPDTTLDPLFRDNPLVVGEPFIRFYIGIPLKMRGGPVIGTLCAMDYHPRELSPEDIDVLQDLASMVVDAIELRRLATTDSLTGALTRRGFEMEIGRAFVRAQRIERDLSLIAFDIDHFKSVNDRYGHAVGDVVLQSLVSAVRQDVRPADFMGRMGGEEFVIALPDTTPRSALIQAERMRERIAAMAIDAHGHTIRVTASFGVAACGAGDPAWAAALENADVALYRAKRRGRNLSCLHESLRAPAAA